MSQKRNTNPPSVFIDANIVIRFLVRDDEKKAVQVKQLFLHLEAGKIRAETDVVVVAEIIWVLSSFYKLNRQLISEYIALFLSLKHLTVKEKPLIQKAVALYQERSVDFIDCYVAAIAIRRNITVCSYDKDFDKFPEVERREPENILTDLAQ